ncbi:unnamed protein product [Chironomus riparius]|uniref:OBP47-like domain-containing protein n=1 Tax=Chironomus riparius TaxID=315576 RepID=A0A9N9RZK6_9DIPT|nr:unnamed protein product [Chironomus riparius]
MKLFILLACVLAVTVAQKEKKPKDDKKNPICSKKLSIKPEDCCPNMPSFKQYFPGCAAQCNVTLPSDNESAPASGKQGRGNKNGKDNKMKCMMPCVLKAANVLGVDGNVSADALNAALLNGVTPDWAQIVPNVVSSCIDNVTAMAKSKQNREKSSEEESERNGTCFNKIVMKCIFKNLYLACPSNIISTNSSCSDLTAKIAQCPCKHGEHGSDEKGESSGNKGGKSSKKEAKGSEKKSQKEQEGSNGGKNEKNKKQESKKDGKGKGKGKTTEEPATAQAFGK